MSGSAGPPRKVEFVEQQKFSSMSLSRWIPGADRQRRRDELRREAGRFVFDFLEGTTGIDEAIIATRRAQPAVKKVIGESACPPLTR